MPYYTKEQIQQARQVDLLTYLQRHDPGELVHVSGGTYCTKSHDSLKISNGKWCWWSRNIGGSTALDYLVKVRGYKLPEAVGMILGEQPLLSSRPVSKPPPKARPDFQLPEQNPDTRRVFAYRKRNNYTTFNMERVWRNIMAKKYSIIYADPPWRYNQKGVSGAAEKHYPTMNIEELCALPVAEISASDSVLFLWTTFPQLPSALQLIKAWGFSYKTVGFVWLKKNRKSDSWLCGMGFWTKGNAEICLLATKGHPKRKAANVHQFIISPIREHSRKPDEAREKIVALMGDLPRIELFARQTSPGWDVWGNEVESTLLNFGPTHISSGEEGCDMAKRNKAKVIRFTDEEWEHLNQEAIKAGVSKERFIRDAIAGIELTPKPPEELASLIKELNAIGNNINQIARIANSKHEIAQQELAVIECLVKQIWEKVLEL